MVGAGGQPPLLFHFSGFSVPSDGRLSKHSRRRFDVATEQVLAKLINKYEQLLNVERERVAGMGISGDLSFSRGSLISRMKRAQKYWGNQFIEFGPTTGHSSRLGKALDRLLS